MKECPATDERLPFYLAQKSLIDEERLKFEQRMILHIVHFTQQLQHKSKQALIAMGINILKQCRKYSDKGCFFYPAFKMVNKQLHKLG